MKYKDLPESDRSKREVDTGSGVAIVYGPPMFLYCEGCDERYSATRGDYFSADPDEEIVCGGCGEPMTLCRERTEITPIDNPPKKRPREAVTLFRHVTTGGAVYLTDNHRFADADVIIRLDGGPELLRCAEQA